MDEIEEKYSDKLFWMVQTVFGVVLGSGLVLHRSCLLHPLDPGNIVALLALFLVYGTTVWSWIDFSYTATLNPYRPHDTYERLRVLSDLLIVILYAILWFAIEDIVGTPYNSLSPLFLGFFFFFVLYLISGLLRVKQHGPKASRILLLVIFTLLYFGLWLLYHYLFAMPLSKQLLNVGSLIVAALLMIAFRTIRRRLARKVRWIGVDVDGVLADQVSPLLPCIKQEYGINLLYNDITAWDLPVGPTNIAQLIESRHRDEDYVRNMPVHPGCADVLNAVFKRHRIAIITSRAEESDRWTQIWLKTNSIPFDRFINTKEKHNTSIDLFVLIDDYGRNIEKFLRNANGIVILFDQPWNQEREHLRQYENARRLFVAHNWTEVKVHLDRILKHGK